MKIILKILKGIVTVFLCVVLLLVIFQKVTNNKLVLGNTYIFQVISESMLPEYKIGDIIVVVKKDASQLNVGDDVTYLGKDASVNGLTITHRIINKREEDNKYYFITKGIHNPIEDPEISQDDIFGKVVYKTVLFSFVGRLMTNIVVYYILFVSVGVAFSYEIVTSFFRKEEEED